MMTLGLRMVALGAALVAQGARADAPGFEDPQRAATALVRAARSADPDALLGVLGPEATPLVASGDPVADRADRERFARSYDARHDFAQTSDTRLVLEVGEDLWPFPIPLVKSQGFWHFDTEAGQQELLDRRVGRNELDTIEACLAYVDAQREYYARDPEGSALLHYARHITSTPGQRDGLYWESSPGEPPSPLGALFAEAQAEGYRPQPGRPIPFHGYYFKVLTAQGPHAEGGAYDYLAHGELLGGFALVAWPAEYGNSGVMTFLVNHDGVVFQKDLGEDTAQTAQRVRRFDPDPTWQQVAPTPENVPAS